MNKSISIGKEQGGINEDAVKSTQELIAVSDGAGGGGVFAEKWSAYLLEKLPNSPIGTADELDAWLETIWEEYYNAQEEEAKQLNPMLLDKFYDEGSFATLAALWRVSPQACQWMSFGDSVVFHYHRKTKKLEHSFSQLSDFNNSPYLLSCKDELQKQGFRSGAFAIDADSVLLMASDALAHYILMMYAVYHPEEYREDLQAVQAQLSKNSNLVRTAMAGNRSQGFEKEVIDALIANAESESRFKSYLEDLHRKGLLAIDDYSLAVMTAQEVSSKRHSLTLKLQNTYRRPRRDIRKYSLKREYWKIFL